MLVKFLTLLIIGFASFRLTRFFIIDTFFDGTRENLHVFFAKKQEKSKKHSAFWSKLYDLSSCTWCFGFWISLILYSLYFWICPIDFNQVNVIEVFAVAGIQGLLHSWESDEE